MEKLLPGQLVPEQLTKVLCSNVQDTRKAYTKVAKYLQSSSYLEKLIQKYFSAYQSRQSLEDILNYTGWELFRLRLIGIYLEYIQDERFPENPNPDMSNEVDLFARAFDRFCVNGYSRHYLLGFYLRAIELQPFSKLHLLDEVQEVRDILAISKFKHEKLDWLILLVWHLKIFFGKDLLLKYIHEHNGDYYSVVANVSKEQREVLVRNLLTYGQSINETELFLFEKV